MEQALSMASEGANRRKKTRDLEQAPMGKMGRLPTPLQSPHVAEAAEPTSCGRHLTAAP